MFSNIERITLKDHLCFFQALYLLLCASKIMALFSVHLRVVLLSLAEEGPLLVFQLHICLFVKSAMIVISKPIDNP